MFLFILLIIETRDDFQRLRALFGVVIFLCIGYFFSYNKFAIKWRPVIAGFSLQLLLGILSLRIEYGRKFFKCLSDKVSVFLHYSKDGSTFVFGESEVFAFSALPTIFFFSLIIQILYYWGVMQWIMHYIGSILQLTLGTTVCESINAAGNIFLANTESAMFIRPYISSLTLSELHAVMVSGFSTVAGSVLLAYISFGAEAYHLVTASLMAAPASLFFAKLFYPEIEKSKTTAENIQIEKS
jgi:pyrimidine nucleoside transport protein